jgi:hypothetical protein
VPLPCPHSRLYGKEIFEEKKIHTGSFLNEFFLTLNFLYILDTSFVIFLKFKIVFTVHTYKGISAFSNQKKVRRLNRNFIIIFLHTIMLKYQKYSSSFPRLGAMVLK